MSKAHFMPSSKNDCWSKQNKKKSHKSDLHLEEEKNEDSVTISVQMNLMHFSRNYSYGDDHVPQEQGTYIMYELHIL